MKAIRLESELKEKINFIVELSANIILYKMYVLKINNCLSKNTIIISYCSIIEHIMLDKNIMCIIRTNKLINIICPICYLKLYQPDIK